MYRLYAHHALIRLFEVVLTAITALYFGVRPSSYIAVMIAGGTGYALLSLSLRYINTPVVIQILITSSISAIEFIASIHALLHAIQQLYVVSALFVNSTLNAVTLAILFESTKS